MVEACARHFLLRPCREPAKGAIEKRNRFYERSAAQRRRSQSCKDPGHSWAKITGTANMMSLSTHRGPQPRHGSGHGLAEIFWKNSGAGNRPAGLIALCPSLMIRCCTILDFTEQKFLRSPWVFAAG